MILVSRAQWGARPPDYVNKAALLAQSTAHWNGPTVTVGGQTVWDHSKCASLVRGIQNFHMDQQGWSDIAYNFMICPHGYVFEGRGINVINGANGTNSGNRSSHALMCLGGEANPFSDVEKEGFKDCAQYVLNVAHCQEGCKGHRDHKLTACPGDERYTWVHDGMPVANDSPTPSAPITEEEENMFAFQDDDDTLWICTPFTFDLLTGSESGSLGHWIQAKTISNAERDIILERIRKNRKRNGMPQQEPVTWVHDGKTYSF